MEYQNSSQTGRIAKFLLFYALAISLIFSRIDPVVASNANSIDFVQHNEQARSVFHEIYQYHSNILNKSSSPKAKSISELEAVLKQYEQTKEPVYSVSLILRNLDLITSNLDNRSILLFISKLLENNEWKTASKLFDDIRREGEKSLVSNISFIFARHHFDNNEWELCLEYTSDIFADLPENDASYAILIAGISLQNLKQHRKAIALYEKIPAKSPSYLYARLNMAVAYIRQGWWTDARNVINQALTMDNLNVNKDDMIDRLYLVLGYSLLQKEYYRDSREAFRNISKNSQYEHRALLGIGLSSANQGDYIGALNVLNLLKSKNKIDLSVDESYLLFPYVYKKLNQQMTASTAYNEAIEYYQKRITELNDLAKMKSPDSDIYQNDQSNIIEIGNNIFDYGKIYPAQFLHNRKIIINLEKTVASWSNKNTKGIKSKFNNLKSANDNAFKGMVNQLITQRKEHLNSYLNQSRYGLASLYDNDISSNN